MATIPNTRTATTTTDVSISPLARLAGSLAFATGVLFTILEPMRLAILDKSDRAGTMANPLFIPNAIAYFVTFCTLLVALVAVYQYQAHRAGTLGLVGFIAALVGTIWMAGDQWFEAFAVPWYGEIAFDTLLAKPSGTLLFGALATYLLYSLGWVLFGIASLRARAFPAAMVLAILVGGAGMPWIGAPAGMLLGVGFGALGVWMLRQTRTTTTAMDQTNNNYSLTRRHR
jgi:hypothetical protein